MDQNFRSDSTDADIAKAEAMLNAINNTIRQTDFDINSEMDRRDRSYEAALAASEEEQKAIEKLLEVDETFHLLYLPDESEPTDKTSLMKKLQRSSADKKTKRKAAPTIKNTNVTSNNKHLDDDDLNDDDDNDLDEEDSYDDDDEDDAEIPEKTNPVKDPFSKEEAVEGKIPDRKLDDLWRVEAVLARKTVKGRLFYKCKWCKCNLVTWNLDQDIENRAAVQQFEAQRHAAAFHETVNKKKLRPVVYVSKKRLERIAKKDPAEAKRLKEEKEQEQIMSELEGVAGSEIIYSCEVEPNIWIPYDDASQLKLEAGWRSKQRVVTITVDAMKFEINFGNMRQTRNGGNSRKIQRVVVQPIQTSASNNSNNNSSSSSSRNSPNFDDMTIQQLRDYVARAQNLQDPHAYEALNRLAERDKATPSGVGKSVVEKFPKFTFEEVMTQICNGGEFPSFSTECHICLEDYVGNTSLTCLPQCQHLFHTKCIEDFLAKYSKFCPICRAQVS